jgi:hypothetical protein
MVVAFFIGDPITGRWQSQPSVNGNVTGVVFKTDSTFEGYVNKKPFVTGKYIFKDDVLTFTDNGCNGAQGVYKIVFFSNQDSLRFEAISDACVERQQGMTRLIMGRVK